MNVIEFRSKLEAMAPSMEQLQSAGFDVRAADRVRSSFVLNERDEGCVISIPDLTLREFFASYHCSTVTVGPLQFNDAPEHVAGGWHIGWVDADPLVLDERDGQIVMWDPAVAGHIISRVAKDGASLLEALIHASIYLTKEMLSNAAPSDGDFEPTIEMCVDAAGGAQYESFYRMLVG